MSQFPLMTLINEEPIRSQNIIYIGGSYIITIKGEIILVVHEVNQIFT
jgi:hypothetical protein